MPLQCNGLRFNVVGFVGDSSVIPTFRILDSGHRLQDLGLLFGSRFGVWDHGFRVQMFAIGGLERRRTLNPKPYPESVRQQPLGTQARRSEAETIDLQPKSESKPSHTARAPILIAPLLLESPVTQTLPKPLSQAYELLLKHHTPGVLQEIMKRLPDCTTQDRQIIRGSGK